MRKPVTCTALALALNFALTLAAPMALATEESREHAAGHVAHTAQDQDHAASAAHGVAALSPPLREALVAEMQAVQAGMMGVIPALAAGNWDEVAAIGKKIRDSYIMQQSLSSAQLEELHDALPPDFKARDAQFHQDAAMLIHVAEAKKPELVGFYVGRMMEACVACHARHAGEKFPALEGRAAADTHAH